MSEQRQQLGIGLCVAFVIALPVLYFLSIGPVVWITSRIEDNLPEWADTSIEYYYVPAEFVYELSPELVQDAMTEYVGLFVGEE
jgi:hypothetical protein